MVRDVHGKLDVLNTTGSCGAPNFRQAKGGYAVFGMGQPSLNGFRLLLQKLQREGHKVGAAQNRGVSAFICGTGTVGAWGSNGRSLGRAAYVLQSCWPWGREGFGKVFGKPCPKTSGAIPDTAHPWLFPGVRLLLCPRGARALPAGGGRLRGLHAAGQGQPPREPPWPAPGAARGGPGAHHPQRGDGSGAVARATRL